MMRSHDGCEEEKGETKMKCYNSFCPFRMDDDDDTNDCVCECCPNRATIEGSYASNSTTCGTTEAATDESPHHFRIQNSFIISFTLGAVSYGNNLY